MKRKRLLDEFPWLEASLVSFNGSGYADHRSPEAFMNSYLAYQQYKRREYGIQMADKYWQSGLKVAFLLCSSPVDRRPTYKALVQFSKFYPSALQY